MDLELEVNPSGVQDDYLAGLNRCFGAWGDRAAYRWDFEREVGAAAADLLVLRANGEIVAGSAVAYRVVRHGESELVVGIMSGSWTLPEARGHGSFSRMIVESRRLVVTRGGSLLIAFVTADNASRRRLVAAGSLEVPTSYVMSGPETPAPTGTPPVGPDDLSVDDLFRAHLRWAGEGSGAYPVYPSARVWASQFLDRPLPVERLTVAGCHCLVERSAASDRVLWLVGPDPEAALAALLARAVRARRQLFLFSVDARIARAGADLGMQVKPGSITLLDARDDATGESLRSALPTEWRLQGGDRA